VPPGRVVPALDALLDVGQPSSIPTECRAPIENRVRLSEPVLGVLVSISINPPSAGLEAGRRVEEALERNAPSFIAGLMNS
jgi:hypothetical protein